MNIQPVKNIIPNILEWAKSQIPNYDVCWGFDGGRDDWFPFDFHASIDWEKACNEKYLGILDCRPFIGVYDSDEIHDYEILFIDGKMVCLSHKVATRAIEIITGLETTEQKLCLS